ncbi:hypothetical protein NPN18_26140, partial [Vibrio parahaemolyticus]|nr:hypothetical protein [Vibrio parahaemolyticus]
MSPNPWQSKHFHLSNMLPFFLFLPVPLQPGHSTAPFPLHVLQPAETFTLAPGLDAMVGAILI